MINKLPMIILCLALAVTMIITTVAKTSPKCSCGDNCPAVACECGCQSK